MAAGQEMVRVPTMLTVPTRSCVAVPTGYHSVRQRTGSRSNLCCAARSTAIWSRSTYWLTMPRPRLVEASQLTDSLRRYDDSYHDEVHW